MSIKKALTYINENVDDDDLRETLSEFARFREEKKRPLTLRGLTLTLKKLEKLAPGDGKAKCDILEQSIENGWTGVFPYHGAGREEERVRPSKFNNFIQERTDTEKILEKKRAQLLNQIKKGADEVV